MSDQPTDYTFMQTGFNNVADVVSEADMKKNAISLIVAFSEGAMVTAAKYVSHCKRTAITPEDLKRGMMLEMFLFKKRDNTLEKAEKIKKELFAEESDEEDEEIEFADECEEFCESSCKCALCKCMNTIYNRWEKFEPSTPFERIFQKHINSMA